MKEETIIEYLAKNHKYLTIQDFKEHEDFFNQIIEPGLLGLSWFDLKEFIKDAKNLRYQEYELKKYPTIKYEKVIILIELKNDEQNWNIDKVKNLCKNNFKEKIFQIHMNANKNINKNTLKILIVE